MTCPSISSADFATTEEREEQRFLRGLKGVLRTEVVELMDRDGLTQQQVADQVGYDPGQLSRLLSPDRHGTTSSMFRVLFRLGKRWRFGAVPVPQPGGNRAPAQAKARITPVPAGDAGVRDVFVARAGASSVRLAQMAISG